jgi:hypothetical protein
MWDLVEAPSVIGDLSLEGMFGPGPSSSSFFHLGQEVTSLAPYILLVMICFIVTDPKAMGLPIMD